MITFTNCKINIGLDVVRRRPDGYHDIVTCMYPIPWHDVIEIIPATGPDSSLVVLGNKVDCPPEKNLVMKAFRRLQSEYDLPQVDIILQKIVPDGAGLGGGSSDAAHTLLLLNDMFALNLDKPRLAEIATQLGADCPFFIYNTPAIAQGIGEILTPIDLDLSGYTIVIAKPQDVNISTKEAYAGITPAEPLTPLPTLLSMPIAEWQATVKNDFEKSIFPLAPKIADLKRLFMRSGAVYTSMSGSGASVYGIFPKGEVPDSLLQQIDSLPHFIFG